MASFPSLPSGNNPSIGAAAGAASSARRAFTTNPQRRVGRARGPAGDAQAAAGAGSDRGGQRNNSPTNRSCSAWALRRWDPPILRPPVAPPAAPGMTSGGVRGSGRIADTGSGRAGRRWATGRHAYEPVGKTNLVDPERERAAGEEGEGRSGVRRSGRDSLAMPRQWLDGTGRSPLNRSPYGLADGCPR